MAKGALIMTRYVIPTFRVRMRYLGGAAGALETSGMRCMWHGLGGQCAIGARAWLRYSSGHMTSIRGVRYIPVEQ